MTDSLNIAKNSCGGLVIVYDHFLWGSEMCLDIFLIHKHTTNTSSIERYSVGIEVDVLAIGSSL